MRPNLAFVLLFLALPALPLLGQETGNPPPASPQPEASIQRFEVGAGVSNISASCGNGEQGCPSVAGGVGTAFNLNRRFSFDANVNFTKNSDFSSNLTGGRLSEYLFGARLETRAKHYGFFIKAQPGLVNWSHIINPANTSASLFGPVNRFVTDLGAGFEYSPTPRIHVRAEEGDLLMRYGSSSWANNFQNSVGVYVGLGKPIDWTPPAHNAKASHRFFDPANDVLIFGSALAWATDAILTHRGIAEGFTEWDPLAKPFVHNGWPGQIAGGGIEMTAEILAMYGAHRIHRHWLERLIPVGVAAAHAAAAYHDEGELQGPKPPSK